MAAAKPSPAPNEQAQKKQATKAQAEPTQITEPSLTHHVVPDDERLSAAADVFRMLSDPTRLHILWMLSQGPADVTALAQACTASRTSVSQHLAKLRFTGMIEAEKDGRRVVYRAVDGHLARLAVEGLNYADHRITGEPSHE